MSPSLNYLRRPQGPAKPLERAFSLVEVTLAIGIISFCICSLIGALPTGLNAMREAAEETIQAQIVQRMTSKAFLTPYDSLGDLTQGAPYFYDEGGFEVERGSRESRFEVMLRQINADYPGSSKAGNLSESITGILVEIRPAGYGRVYSYVIYIANANGT